MKKILSFVVAGALALGLIGCSGDLHDVVPSRIDLSGGGAPGVFNSWTNTTLGQQLTKQVVSIPMSLRLRQNPRSGK